MGNDNCNNDIQQAEAHLKKAEADLAIAQAAEQAARQEILEAEHEIEEELHHHDDIEFFVDGEECETDKRKMTANEIITKFTSLDPATNYLKELDGKKRSFEGRGNEEIKLKDGMHFVVISVGPKPVSNV